MVSMEQIEVAVSERLLKAEGSESFGWNIVERKVIFLQTKILNAFLDTLFSNRGNNDNNLRMVMDRSLAWISSSQLTFFLKKNNLKT